MISEKKKQYANPNKDSRDINIINSIICCTVQFINSEHMKTIYTKQKLIKLLL